MSECTVDLEIRVVVQRTTTRSADFSPKAIEQALREHLGYARGEGCFEWDISSQGDLKGVTFRHETTENMEEIGA